MQQQQLLWRPKPWSGCLVRNSSLVRLLVPLIALSVGAIVWCCIRDPLTTTTKTRRTTSSRIQPSFSISFPPGTTSNNNKSIGQEEETTKLVSTQYLREEFQTTTTTSQPSQSQPPKRPSLTVGDLPGYTGWARPSTTTAHWYQVRYPIHSDTTNSTTTTTTTIPRVGVPYTLFIVCRPDHHDDCRSHQALFYIRAYGPTIVTGPIIRRQSSTGEPPFLEYQATLVFWQAGDHVLELVLTYSHVPSLEQLSTMAPGSEPAYEGYLLPDMPTRLTVVADPESLPEPAPQPPGTIPTPRLGDCQPQDLYETSPTSAVHRGIWSLTHHVRYPDHEHQTGMNNATRSREDNAEFPLEGYQDGSNSIGFRMDYQPVDCHLLSLKELVVRIAYCIYKLQMDLHVVFVGDSNMDHQLVLFCKVFASYHRHVHSSMWFTNNGLFTRLDELHDKLDSLKRRHEQDTAANAKPTRYFLLFNAGLHDVEKLCVPALAGQRPNQNQTYLAHQQQQESNNSTCVDQYRHDLTQLVTLLHQYQDLFDLTVFETTIAGWLRWGVYGITWPLTERQVYPRDAHACHMFNRVAWQVLQRHQASDNHSTIPTIDAYWLSLSRPDHREIKIPTPPKPNSTKPAKPPGVSKLVHLGMELYQALLRKWLTLILASLEAQLLHQAEES